MVPVKLGGRRGTGSGYGGFRNKCSLRCDSGVDDVGGEDAGGGGEDAAAEVQWMTGQQPSYSRQIGSRRSTSGVVVGKTNGGRSWAEKR